MRENKFNGKLIAVDGPNGVGKTTIIEKLKRELELKGYKTYITKEPTDTILGNFIRDYAEDNVGIGLACMVAADRYEHLKNEITPHLIKDTIVITDRYILSSLILQGMDGVDSNFIFAINDEIIKPDLQVAVFAGEEIIQKRLLERETLTRFEKDNQSSIEIEYLKQGIMLLEEKDVNVHCVINNDVFEKNIMDIVECISNLY